MTEPTIADVEKIALTCPVVAYALRTARENGWSDAGAVAAAVVALAESRNGLLRELAAGHREAKSARL